MDAAENHNIQTSSLSAYAAVGVLFNRGSDLIPSSTPCLKKTSPLACYNFEAHEWILIFFGRNVIDKVGNQKTLYYATSNNLCFCTTWKNAKT